LVVEGSDERYPVAYVKGQEMVGDSWAGQGGFYEDIGAFLVDGIDEGLDGAVVPDVNELIT
jgi:hypothetical protein